VQPGILTGKQGILRRKRPICKAFATPITCTNFGRRWVRVFEVGSARIAEAEAIKANIDMAGKTYSYWTRVQKAVWSEPTVLELCSLSWKEAVSTVDMELVKAKEKFAEAHITWMKPTRIDL
jgi:hypothetical protein